MYPILMVLGVVAALAGAGALVFGIPNIGFDVGNTAILGGIPAFVGGLILIALAEAVRHLRRIAESLSEDAGRLPRDVYEPADVAPRAAPGRIPFPPKPEPRPRVTAPTVTPEPRLETAPAIHPEHPEEPAPAFGRAAPEPRIPQDADEAPLSPQPEPRFAAAGDRDKDELSEGLLATAFSRLDVALRTAPRREEPVQQEEMFEPLRPPELRTEPEPSRAPEESPASEPAAESQEEEKAEAPYAVSILKSGIIDGMAYTLYSDGSIEAELPQGTMRFASVIELRAYLQKSSS
jgi:hypothetical protein